MRRLAVDGTNTHQGQEFCFEDLKEALRVSNADPAPNLLDDLTEDQIRQLVPLVESKHFSEGEVVFAEGDTSRLFYVVASGGVEIVKPAHDLVLERMEPGAVFGAMAVFDEIPRNVTARATRDSVLIEFEVEDLKVLAEQHTESLYSILLKNQLRVQNERLLAQTEATVAQLEQKLAETSLRASMGRFITFVIALMCLWGAALRLGLWLDDLGFSSTVFTSGLLVVFVMALIWMIGRGNLPMRLYGLTLEGWREHTVEALVWSAVFCLVMTGLKWGVMAVVPSFSEGSLFSLSGFEGGLTPMNLSMVAVYALFCPFQEFVARGACQGSLEHLLIGRASSLRANVIANLLFATTHLHMSPYFAAAVFLPGLFWGAMFSRQRGLVGPSISHALIGIYVMFVLGLPGV